MNAHLYSLRSLLVIALAGFSSLVLLTASLSSASATAEAVPTASDNAGAAAAATATTTASSTASDPGEVVAPTSPIRALDARLVGPDGLVSLVFDKAGNLYISECLWTFAAIVRVDRAGMMTTFAGTGVPGFSGDGGPATSAQFFCPRGMAFGRDGAMYVGDHVNNRVRRIDASGTITTVVGSGPAGLNQGSFSGDGGPATEATLQEPEQVAFDDIGNLYIGDRDNNRIRKVATNGLISTIAGNGQAGYSGDGGPGYEASINTPYGVVAAWDGVIFADGGNSRVRMIDHAGLISTLVGTGEDASTGDGGNMEDAAIAPGDIGVDEQENLYLTDDASHSLRQVGGMGEILKIAGNGGVGVPVDGMLALDAPFPVVRSPAFSRGDLYITDQVCVYRIDHNGVIAIVAGHH